MYPTAYVCEIPIARYRLFISALRFWDRDAQSEWGKDVDRRGKICLYPAAGVDAAPKPKAPV